MNLIGFINVAVQVGKRTIKRTRIVFAKDGKKSLVGRDWLTQLNFRLAEVRKIGAFTYFVNSLVKKIEMAPEWKKIQQVFAKIFYPTTNIFGLNDKV